MPGPGPRGGGFHGRPGGPAFRPVPPPPAARVYGRPGFRFAYGHGPRRGPWGSPWCCWPFLILLLFCIFASIGVSLIHTLATCSSRSSGRRVDDNDSESTGTCEEYEAIYVVSLAVVMLCCGCCLVGRKTDAYDPLEGTQGEREPILATQASPPPPTVYGNARPIFVAQV